MKQYYYLTDANEQMGPLSEDDLLQYINSETLVFCEGLTNWTAAKDVEALMQYFDFSTEEATTYQETPAEESDCAPVPAVPKNVPEMPGEYEPKNSDFNVSVSNWMWYVGLGVFLLWVISFAMMRVALTIH